MLLECSQLAVCVHVQYKFGQKQPSLQVAMHSQLPRFLVIPYLHTFASNAHTVQKLWNCQNEDMFIFMRIVLQCLLMICNLLFANTCSSYGCVMITVLVWTIFLSSASLREVELLLCLLCDFSRHLIIFDSCIQIVYKTVYAGWLPSHLWKWLVFVTRLLYSWMTVTSCLAWSFTHSLLTWLPLISMCPKVRRPRQQKYHAWLVHAWYFLLSGPSHFWTHADEWESSKQAVSKW